MASRLAIYHPPGRLALGRNVFGKDVANIELYRALAHHGGLDELTILSHQQIAAETLREDLGLAPASAPHLKAGTVLNQAAATEAGALLRGKADLADLAWLRRTAVGDSAYSLLGLVHTIAPPAIREYIAAASVAPTQPWDALICTSPAVQTALGEMFDDWTEHLGRRFGGAARPRPALPLIPLGVDGGAFQAVADRPEARAALRARLELGEADVLVLWVGRLSFFEKAFPQPMFAAVARAAEAAGVKVAFAMAGWFPGAETDHARYRQAAEAHAPGVPIHFLDGNDRDLLGQLWAGADIFLSLVDNIQETFGITPLEAMAAGLPVVASDWDGYRYTIEHDRQGFLVPTLGGPPGGLGATLAARHVMAMDSYQAYVGAVAQHTAVHVGRAAEALARLIASPDLRRRMGAAGRERIRTTFDWPVVARQVGELVDELAQIRSRAGEAAAGRANPVKGDPFADFAGFATQVIGLETPLAVPPGVTAAQVAQAEGVDLDRAFGGLRATLPECVQAFELVAGGQARTVRQVLQRFPPPRRRAVELGLVWMCKLGWLDWLA